MLPTNTTRQIKRRVDVDITSMRRKENINAFPNSFEIFFLFKFDEKKILVVLTYFFDVISMSEKWP